MGERNSITEAIILTVKASGENNRTVCALSPDKGIFYATLYGGPKSKLKAMVQPFNVGKIWLYNDETKHMIKITDFDVYNFHLSFRTDLYKMWAANLSGEIVLKTRGGGDFSACYRLLKAFLDGIDLSTEEGSRLGTIRFLWRYLTLLGVQPEIHNCSSCGNSILYPDAVSHYIDNIHSFLCSDCISSENAKTGIEIDGNGATYLAAINDLSPGKVRQLEIGASSVYKIKNLVFYLIEQSCGGHLDSLSTGIGIL